VRSTIFIRSFGIVQTRAARSTSSNGHRAPRPSGLPSGSGNSIASFVTGRLPRREWREQSETRP
jgi:hypothetical protein